MGITDRNLEVVRFNQHLYFEWFTTFEWESRLPFFLSPDIIQPRIANNESLVFIEAWVKVEGNIIPSLEV
ncbi:hypothetical protein VULLAG_LOCUS16991 [Vulpes lagopus]